MSLAPIGITFAVVAILFTGFGAVSARATDRVWGLGVRVSSPPPGPKTWRPVLAGVWLGATVEALLLVLLAALWFASLGHGGWPLVFVLLGALVSGAEGFTRRGRAGTSAGTEVKLFLLGLLKYVAAGLVSAWLLS